MHTTGSGLMSSDPGERRAPDLLGEEVERELVAAVARRAIADAAPEELPLFSATSAAYFSDPGRVTKPREGQDTMLGFGVDAALVLVTPAALEAAKAVVRFVASEIATAAKAGAAPRIQAVVRRLFGLADEPARDAAAPEADPEVPPLSPDQLRQVRQVVTDTADRLRLSKDRAAVLADAIVGTLAV